MPNAKNSFFNRITLAICSSLNLEETLASCFTHLKGKLPLDRLIFGALDPDHHSINHVASVTASGPTTDAVCLALPPDIFEKLHRGITRDRLVPDTRKDELTAMVAPYVQNRGFSEILLFLQGHNDRPCYLVAQAKGVNRYTQEHFELLRSIREPLRIAMTNAIHHMEVVELKRQLEQDNLQLKRKLEIPEGTIIGAETGLAEVMEQARKVARQNSTVLILGETGVGKELIAAAIHNSSPRRDGPFIKVNCGAIPESLIDSELFGHEKGAFTGALRRREGCFERAAGGTILLDEIGELPPAAQARLLRVLQNHEIIRVGGQEAIPVDIRIIAATNRDLTKMVAQGAFREDLWFRISTFPIHVPPLRQRKQDIPLLLRYFLARKSTELGMRTVPDIAPGAIEALTAYNWPGNVRELANAVERALIQNRGRTLTLDAFSLSHSSNMSREILGENCECVFPCLAKGNLHPGKPATLQLDEVLRRHIRLVLDMTAGRVHGKGGAAELLGINPSTLRSKMNKLGMTYGRGRR